MLEGLGSGFLSLLTLSGILAMLLGLIWGTIGAALPGISGPQAMALLLPLTFVMDVGTALMLLAGVWVGANYGGSIPAILIRTPGTASNAAAVIDGNALARQGKAGKALGVSLVCGCIGGFISVVLLIALVVPLGQITLSFASPEIFALTVFGLTVIATVAGPSMIKGIAAALFGLLLTTVGLDQITGAPRFTFGRPELLSGFELIAVLIGFFAIAEMLYQIARPGEIISKIDRSVNTKLPTLRELTALRRSTAIGSGVGIVVGMVGAGGAVSSFVAYGEAKRWSKEPEKFGKGSMEGVAAPETANNSDQGGALVPALALGIPSSASAAIILAALILQGVRPGPALMAERSDVLYTFFAALLVTNVLMLPVGIAILRLCIAMVSVRAPLLISGVLVLSLIGTYSLNRNPTDVVVAVVFGFIGYAMKVYGFSPAAAVLGLVLGYIMEGELRRSMMMSLGSPEIFLNRPIAAVVLLLAALVLLRPLIARVRRGMRNSRAPRRRSRDRI
jgi:putative tricarboxylic transport membrane protein